MKGDSTICADQVATANTQLSLVLKQKIEHYITDLLIKKRPWCVYRFALAQIYRIVYDKTNWDNCRH